MFNPQTIPSSLETANSATMQPRQCNGGSIMRAHTAIGFLATLSIGLVWADGSDPREIRLAPQDFNFRAAGGAGAGTSGVSGIRTIVLKGDPSKSGLYTIL